MMMMTKGKDYREQIQLADYFLTPGGAIPSEWNYIN
jgi:hypothetical protein